MLVVNKDVGDSVQGLRVILDWRCIAALAPEKKMKNLKIIYSELPITYLDKILLFKINSKGKKK